jgi:hypothetical protein
LIINGRAGLPGNGWSATILRVAVRRTPETWGLVLLVVVLVGLGTAVAVWWPRSGLGESAGQRVSATVVKTGSCGARELDAIELKVDGQLRKARLDGCGYREGATVDVLLPADTSGEFTAQTAGAVSDAAPLSVRLATLMLCLSGLAGGFYVYLITKPVPRLRSVN